MEGVDELGVAGARQQMRLEIERRHRTIEMGAIELAHPACERRRGSERGHALEEPFAGRVRRAGGDARVRVARRQRDRALGEIEWLRTGAATVVVHGPRFVPPAVSLACRL